MSLERYNVQTGVRYRCNPKLPAQVEWQMASWPAFAIAIAESGRSAIGDGSQRPSSRRAARRVEKRREKVELLHGA